MRIAVSAAVTCLSIVGVTAAADVQASIRKHTDIPAQDLDTALRTLAQEREFQIIYLSEQVQPLFTPGVSGDLTVDEALHSLLNGSGLQYRHVDDKTVSISGPASDSTASGPSDNSRAPLEEVVVTGSNIRGADNSASPLEVFTRKDIRESGVSNTQQFIQNLTQNFTGGTSETTIGGILGGEGSNLNYGSATGANLRGLGNDATLTLLNGRRMAPVGVGEAVDLSSIPLSAIERIDVLTDGASAVYGSDAVAGVVNIILRKEYDGAETRLRYGTVTEGSSKDVQAGQTVGASWSTGNVFASYEYARRTDLSTEERSFTRGNQLFTNASLIPDSLQHSAIVVLNQQLGDGVSMYVNGTASRRDNRSEYMSSSGLVSTPTFSDQLGANAGLQFTLPGDWRADTGLSYSRNEMNNTSFYSGVFDGTVNMESSASVLDVKLDGSALNLPGGDVKVAVGSQYRRETFNSDGDYSNTKGEDKRNISAVFGEMLVPIIGAGNEMAGAKHLDLSLAARYEHYSDFGSTTNPKLGLAWSPATGVNLRGTYGKSFRAPSLYEMSPNAFALAPYVYNFPDPQSPSGSSYTIVLLGNNPDLTAEKAKTWSAGFDIQPQLLGGVQVSATYFDIRFENRAGLPVPYTDFFSMLTKESEHAFAVTHNPPLALVQSYFDNPRFDDGGVGVTPSDIAAIANDQLANVAQSHQEGVDLTLSYRMTLPVGALSLRSNGTYILDSTKRVTAGSPELKSYDLARLPAALKLRGSVGWSYGGLGITAFVNHTGTYRNELGTSNADVASWTTVDLSARYDTGSQFGWLRDVQVTASAINLLDRAPPYVYYYGLNFDATNASATGRFLSLEVSKQFGGGH